MAARPLPEDLLPWALAELGLDARRDDCALHPVAGDASNRRYHRLSVGQRRYILAESPPATEKNAEFLAVREMLDVAGIRVPRLFAADLARGYLLLEDLGNRLLLDELQADTADSCYGGAFDVLLRMAELEPRDPDGPVYDHALLIEELSRFPEWYVRQLLGYTMSTEEWQHWQALVDLLVANALEQPTVVVHRDYHSRNLMPQSDGSLGVIDFQDAVMGPITYDLVSLLKDCYIQWPAERVRNWVIDYHGRLCHAGLLAGVSRNQFMRWFDLMGLQRHLKVLGTFARLYLRDGKEGYLRDLPLVNTYVVETLSRYRPEEPIICAFAEWFQSALADQAQNPQWSRR